MNPMRNPSRRTGALKTLPTSTADVSVLPPLPAADAQPSLTLWNHVREEAFAWRRFSMFASGESRASGGWNQDLRIMTPSISKNQKFHFRFTQALICKSHVSLHFMIWNPTHL